jgi:hypothetical protein
MAVASDDSGSFGDQGMTIRDVVAAWGFEAKYLDSALVFALVDPTAVAVVQQRWQKQYWDIPKRAYKVLMIYIIMNKNVVNGCRNGLII